MKCTYCIEKEKDWSRNSSPIICAFELGSFFENNFNCGIMDILRGQANKTCSQNDDTFAGIIPYSFEKDDEIYGMGYLYLEWYKSRGKTDKCYDMADIEPLTLDKAYEICSSLKK